MKENMKDLLAKILLALFIVAIPASLLLVWLDNVLYVVTVTYVVLVILYMVANKPKEL